MLGHRAEADPGEGLVEFARAAFATPEFAHEGLAARLGDQMKGTRCNHIILVSAKIMRVKDRAAPADVPQSRSMLWRSPELPMDPTSRAPTGSSTPRVRVFLAMSLDGFIAGAGDDLSWLPDPPPDMPTPADAVTYEALMADVGTLLMGRRTYDVVRGFDVPWPYEGKRVLVATRRPLDENAPAGVQAAQGDIAELIARARSQAPGDVYLDGGKLIRQACAAGLVDEVVISVAPIAIGEGIPLFAGLASRYPLRLTGTSPYPAGMVQLRMEPIRRGDRQPGSA